MRRLAVFILSALTTVANAQSAPGPVAGGDLPPASAGNNLPDIGTPADSVWTQEEEYQIGRMVVKGLRDAGQILDDPEITEYLQTLGDRLVSHAQDKGQRFQFFAVKSPDLNAFAVPGGFIGVNMGLLLATKNESELAGVLAHEVAHVTQRHIARSVRAQGRSGMVSAAAMLAAILLGAVGGGDAAMGAIAMAQGAAMQSQINFTRANEAEADRIGIVTMVAAGFNPSGIPDFWETVNRHYGADTGQIPELLRTHPLTSNRIAEARDRIRELRRGGKAVPDTLSYQLGMERLRLLSTPDGSNPVTYHEKLLASASMGSEDSRRYGRAISLMAAGSAAEALPILQKLAERHDDVIQYRTALAQAQMQAGRQTEALATFEQAYILFPRNVPLTMRYAEALVSVDQAKHAHRILLDLFNTVPPTPEQARFIALAANTAGDVADSYSYMAEYHVMSGELMLAINQLELALAVPQISEVQRARFQARLDQLREYLPKKDAQQLAKRRRPEDGNEGQRPWRD